MRVALRLLSALALLGAAPATPPPSLAGFMAARGYSAVPLTKLSTGHDAVPVTLNGIATTFVLDSGAQTTVLNSRVREKFGIKPADQLSVGAGVGAGGIVRATSYSIRGLRIGDGAVPLTQINAIDLGNFVMLFKQTSSREIDGVVGQDVLTRYGGVIDVAAGQLYLRLPAR